MRKGTPMIWLIFLVLVEVKGPGPQFGDGFTPRRSTPFRGHALRGETGFDRMNRMNRIRKMESPEPLQPVYSIPGAALVGERERPRPPCSASSRKHSPSSLG
jgi:hypothetical protein